MYIPNVSVILANERLFQEPEYQRSIEYRQPKSKKNKEKVKLEAFYNRMALFNGKRN